MQFRLDLKLLAVFSVITVSVMLSFVALRYSLLQQQLGLDVTERILPGALALEVLQALVVGSLFFGLLFVFFRESLAQPMKSMEVARQTLDSIADAVIVTDEYYQIVDVNAAFEVLTGFSKEEVLGTRPDIKASEHCGDEPFWQEIQESSQWSGEIVVRRKEQLSFSAWLKFNKVWYEDGLACYVGVISDITEKKQAERQLQRMAYFDSLTSLPNRSHFIHTLEYEINVAERHSRSLGVLFLDLDNFKWVNDRYGHQLGDRYLECIASKFQARARKTDFVFRMGGDEFTFIINDLGDEEALDVLANDLIAIGKAPIKLDKYRIRGSASIGIAVYPRDAGDAQTLIKQADTAMYQAKEQGNSVVFFSPELEQRRKNTRETEDALRRAITKDELVLFFQPKIHYKTRVADGNADGVEVLSSRVLGAEALLRWFRSGHDIINPASFIGVAEQSHLILDIGEWVLEKACKQLSLWQTSPLHNLTLAVNLSPSHLNSGDCVQSLAEKIARYNIDPEKLQLEITESAVIENISHSVDILNQLKGLGVSIAMDDFGTGFSSLSYLKQLPIDVIKIDRSFVNELPNDEDDVVIVNAIFSISKAMNIAVVAEGIENYAQLQFLLAQGCEYSQGYYHSRPLPRADFEHWVSIYRLRMEKALADLNQGQRQTGGMSPAILRGS